MYFQLPNKLNEITIITNPVWKYIFDTMLHYKATSLTIPDYTALLFQDLAYSAHSEYWFNNNNMIMMMKQKTSLKIVQKWRS